MAETKFQFVFLLIALILVLVKLFERLMDRIDQPRVLGEVILGIIIGPSLLSFISLDENPTSIFSSLLGLDTSTVTVSAEIIEFLAEVGVLFLLFEVGLEIEFDILKRVGNMATGAAVAGIIVPFLGGMGLIFVAVSIFGPEDLVPGSASLLEVAFFMGAALTATSVGISIRVFIEMNSLNSRVARTVVAAAVIDDIISIILLTLAITYREEAAALGIENVLVILVKIISFFVITFILFQYVMPWYTQRIAYSTDRYLPLITGLVLVFFLAWLASVLNLAGIIGAFIAGLLVNRDKEFSEQVKALFSPIAHWVVPFFFIGVGLRVNVAEVLNPTVILLGVIITVLAIITKLVGGIIGTWFTRFEWHESQLVGLAMSARGEVTLIFAAEALLLGFFTQSLFSATILMVILNAIIVPPLLKYALQYWENTTTSE